MPPLEHSARPIGQPMAWFWPLCRSVARRIDLLRQPAGAASAATVPVESLGEGWRMWEYPPGVFSRPPIPPATRIDVLLRGAGHYETRRADEVDWLQRGGDSDVVAWRMAGTA